MKIPESVVMACELLCFMLGLAILFLWAMWQDGSAWFLRRVGFRQLADEREAVAARTFNDVLGFDPRD